MGMDNLENKIKHLYDKVKSGKITKEIAHEASELIEKVEDVGGDIKDNLSEMIDDMKNAIKKFK